MADCPPPSISCDTAGAVSTPYDDYNASYNNYPRGVYWAPRGKHLVSYFADNTCRVFDADEGLSRPLRTERASGTITAMEMCPLGSEPSDFHYAVSVRDRPIHLVNLLTGEVAASYQGFSLTDEVTAASCLSFSQDGSRLLGGVAGQPQVWLWDLTRPGKSAYHRVLSTRKGKTGQRGIVSAAAWLDDKCYALGTYSRTIGIYDERQGSKKNAKCVKMLSAPDGGGITSLKYDILTGERLSSCLVSSSGTPCVAAQIEPVSCSRIAVATGQRVWPTYVSMGDDENTELLQPKTDNRVAVVKFSAPEGLLSVTLPSAAEVAPQRQEQAETAPASAPGEAAATLPTPPEPQSVDILDTFKGLPPPPGVPAPPPSSEVASNGAVAGSAESLPSQAQTETDAGRLPEAPAVLVVRAPSLSATNPSEGLDQEEADPLNTGVTVWPSSAELASRLIDESGSGGLLDVSGKRVIELGSGCGLGGLACAAADASKVTITDLPEVLNDVTKRNIGANSVLTWTCDLQAKPLAWPGEDSAELGDCDVVLGADLIYREADVDLLLAAIRNLTKQNNARKFIWMQPSRDPIANAKAMKCFKENHHSVTTVGPDLYVVDLTPSTGEEHPTASDEPEAQDNPVVVSEEVHRGDEGDAVKPGAKRSREATSEDDTEPTKRSRTRRASVYPGMESYNAAVFTAFEGCAVRSADGVDGEKSPTSEDASD